MTFTLNDNFEFRGADYSTSQATAELPRHRWYIIKEGFSPKLVEAAIDSAKLTAHDLIVDPFCGSGTVPLTAAKRGMRTIGIEVNPFLSFVSTTKLRNCDDVQLKCASARIVDAIHNRKTRKSLLEEFSTFSKSSGLKKWLFNASVLRSFDAGWRAVSVLKPQTRRFLRLALIKAAMENCNAKTDGKCLRYKRDWRDLRYDSAQFVDSFVRHMDTVAADIASDVVPQVTTSIVNQDSRTYLSSPLLKGFRLCVTSPPYLNSFDYCDVYRPELFLAGYVADNQELRKIRMKTLRSHVQVRWKKPQKNSFGQLYKSTIEQVRAVKDRLWDERLPMMIQAYFEDMHGVLASLKEAAGTNAYAWFVVSTSAYGGIEIPVDLILAEIGERIGWFLQEIGVVRHVRHAGHHWNRISPDARKSAWLRESVVVFRSNARPS